MNEGNVMANKIEIERMIGMYFQYDIEIRLKSTHNQYQEFDNTEYLNNNLSRLLKMRKEYAQEYLNPNYTLNNKEHIIEMIYSINDDLKKITGIF